jgi:hypothetical protein
MTDDDWIKIKKWLALSAKKDIGTLAELGIEYSKDAIEWCTAQGFCTHTRKHTEYRFKNIKKIKAWLSGAPVEQTNAVAAPVAAPSIFKTWNGVFTHAKIADGRLYLAAHTATFSTPFEGPNCQPDLERLVRAVKALPAASRSLSADGASLVFSEGNTTVRVPVHDQPIGLFSVRDLASSCWQGALLPVLEMLRPFLVVDTVTPWKGAIAFSHDGFATVCTGSVIVQLWTGCPLGDALGDGVIVLPAATIDALLAIGTEPAAIVCGNSAIAFAYPDGSALETGLYAPVFPDIKAVWPQRDGLAPVGELPTAVNTVRKISTADLVRLGDGVVSDHRLEGLFGEVTVTVEGLAGKGFFINAATLTEVLKIATHIVCCDDGKLYFEGAKLRGVVMCGR